MANQIAARFDHSLSGLTHMERSIFYTPWKMVLLHLISALCSFVLSFIIASPLTLYAVPFYVYSGSCFLLLIISLKRSVTLDSGIAIKVLIDIIFTVYWIDLHGWKTGTTQLYFLPIIMLYFVFLYNMRLNGFAWFYCSIFGIVIANGIVFLMLSGNGKSSPVNGVVYYLIVALTVWAYIVHSRFKAALLEDMKSKEERIDGFVNSRKTFSLSARIVGHEIANELMVLSHCAYLLKHRKEGSFVRELDEIKQCMDNIPRYLKMLSDQEAAPTGLLAVLKVVFPGKHAGIDVDGEVNVYVPMPLLVSFVNNIYENALQAYERNSGSDEGFHIDVRFDGTTLVIDDNAGGFDISSIALGKSSKGPGHGIFLATFLSDTGHLGLHPSIERIEGGTRVKIVFDRVEKPGE